MSYNASNNCYHSNNQCSAAKWVFSWTKWKSIRSHMIGGTKIDDDVYEAMKRAYKHWKQTCKIKGTSRITCVLERVC